MRRGGSLNGPMPHAGVAFGSRPYRAGDVSRALDATIEGLRTLGLFAGADEVQLGATASLSALVRAAEPGVPTYVGEGRVTYGAHSLASGARCRSLLASLHLPAGTERETDPVVKSSLHAEVDRVASGESATLLRMALAAEVSTRTGTARSARNPLGGVLDLLEMGAVVSTTPEGADALVCRDGRRLPLEWTGGMFARGAAGRLVLSDESGLSF